MQPIQRDQGPLHRAVGYVAAVLAVAALGGCAAPAATQRYSAGPEQVDACHPDPAGGARCVPLADQRCRAKEHEVEVAPGPNRAGVTVSSRTSTIDCRR